MRVVLGLIAVLGVLRTVGSLWFGGERLAPGDDVEEPQRPGDPEGDKANWHHQDITGQACQQRGFTDPARRSIQWHADYIDSYVYNPIFWAQGGLPRLRRALMLREHLVKLHFDDLMDGPAIAHVWVRYLSGTVAGLHEAALRGDVAAGRHLIGLSLHAIQDFYAHSNWVDDPARRATTYLELGVGRSTDPLYTGTYERPDTQGIKPHGHYQFLSPVLQREPLRTVLTAYCHPRSPGSGTAVCAAFRETADSTWVRANVLGRTLPDGAVAVSEGGIALDNRWIADQSATNRNTTDAATGEALFTAAKDLALRDSVRWLAELEQVVTAAPETAAFWARLLSEPPVEAADRAAVYEDVERLPVLFTAVGDYPPASATAPDDGSWYLYLQVGTGDNGTNAEVSVEVDGRSFALDHGALADIVTGFDDFRPGSTVAYAVGPLAGLPESIVVRHRVKQYEDLVAALRRAATRVGQAVVDIATGLLPGGDGELIGRASRTWDSAALDGVKQAGSLPWSLRVGKPGSEGLYDLTGTITHRGDLPGPGKPGSLAETVSEFTVSLDRVTCVQESGTDGIFTPSDEVYLLTTLTNHTGLPTPPGGPGPVEGWLSPVWTGVDSGDSTTDLNRTWTLQVPAAAGAATLGVEAWEEDNETDDARRRRQDGFTKAVGTRGAATISDIVDVLASTVEDGWDLRSITAFAFQRRLDGSRWCTLGTDLTARRLGRSDSVTVALTPVRSGEFTLFAS